MRPIPFLLLGLCAVPTAWAQEPSCDSLRARIQDQTGTAVRPDPDFLATLAARKDCAFTTAELYRAAYGDRPVPPSEPYVRHERFSRHGDGGDDD